METFGASRPRVAVFAPSLEGGGAERAMLYLVSGLVDKGYPVDLVLVQAIGPYLSRLDPRVRIVDLGAARMVKALPKLVHYLRKRPPRVLISTLDHSNLIALTARRMARVSVPVVVNVQNTVTPAADTLQPELERFLPPLIRRFYPWAEAVTAVSQGVADDLVHVVGIPSDRVHVIFNPVVTSDLRRMAEAEVSHPFFAAGAPPVLLGVGRLTRQKAFPDLIEAFEIVRQKKPCRLLILGEGEDRPKLERLIASRGLRADVSLPGYVDNPYAYMSRAHVFVLSSLWEGLPTVLIEAAACGTPVVATDCPSGPREILDHGRFGKLVPMNNPAALADAVLDVLAGRYEGVPEAWLMRFTQEAAIDAYCGIIDALAGAAPSTAAMRSVHG